MIYTQFSYPQTCKCGKQFFVIFQDWGRIEQINPKLNKLCFKCTNARKRNDNLTTGRKRLKNVTKINLLEQALDNNIEVIDFSSFTYQDKKAVFFNGKLLTESEINKLSNKLKQKEL